MIGRIYDESIALHGRSAGMPARVIGLGQRPPLDQFLAHKDEILKNDNFPDENKYYTE